MLSLTLILSVVRYPMSNPNWNINHQTSNTMSENKHPGAAGQSAGEESNYDKLKNAAGDMADAAGKAWDKAEDKAEELWDKAKSGELKEEAKEKLSDLKDGASKLWDKIVDKFDGDDESNKKA